MKKFRFRNFQVYQDTRKFTLSVKNFSKEKFPKEEKYGIKSQLWRALDSVILNIAEGSDRSTDKDFALFLNRAHTSLNEVVAVLDIAVDLEYITKNEHAEYLKEAELLANQITAFRRKLINSFNK
jgi:four helix bundle protein